MVRYDKIFSIIDIKEENAGGGMPMGGGMPGMM